MPAANAAAVALTLTFVFFFASAANALLYGDFSGDNVDFLSLEDTTTSSGDPDGLYGTPFVSGDQLIFFPTEFYASGQGGSSDLTSATLSVVIDSTTEGASIGSLDVTEIGDYDLSGVGTSATNVNIEIGGYVIVLEANSSAITPVIIPFDATFTPGSTFALPDDRGFGTWEGGVSIDIASTVANATKVHLQLTNLVAANTEQGTTALIQKKILNGPVIKITAISPAIPEPSGALLFGAGILALCVAGRGDNQLKAVA